MKYDTVLLSKIVPDVNQPRHYFAADKLNLLKESIKREGIISPLIVEKVGEGYLLLDGERRFRAATELNLKHVPVIVEDARNATDRLIRQFTVQEQHEGWTPIEKAMALTRLSEELGIGLQEVCKLLNISPSTTRQYVAFSRLADKEGYMKSEVPLEFVTYINSVRNSARRESSNQLKEEFTRSDDKKLEKRIVADIRSGNIVSRDQISKLGFAFEKNPKSIKKYMADEKTTAEGLFLSSGAQGARALRNINFNATYLTRHLKVFMQNPDVKVTNQTILSMKHAKDELSKFITAFEK